MAPGGVVPVAVAGCPGNGLKEVGVFEAGGVTN